MKYFPVEKRAYVVFKSLKIERTALFNGAVNYKGGMD
jgi:hypothetical protein